MKKHCFQCKIQFKGRKERNYCSRKCYDVSQKGKKLSDETKRKLREFNLRVGKRFPVKIGEKNSAWKGDMVGYRALHEWVEKWLGKPGTCEHCGRMGLKSRAINWANKSKKYKRDFDDWIRLCTRCHGRYDRKIQV